MYSKIIENAIRLVSYWHRGQMRRDGIFDYWIHPIAVGMMLSKAGTSDEVVAAGICHDLLEDTKCPELEIAQACSDEVLKMVKNLTLDNSILDWKEQTSAFIIKIKESSDQVKLIFVADKIHNLQSLMEILPEKGLKFFKKLHKTPEEKLWLEDQRCLMLRQALKHPLIDEYDRLVDEFVDLLEDLVEQEEKIVDESIIETAPVLDLKPQINIKENKRIEKSATSLNNNKKKHTSSQELSSLQSMQIKINYLEKELRKKLQQSRLTVNKTIDTLSPAANSVRKPRSRVKSKFAYLKKDEIKLLLPAILSLIIKSGKVDTMLLQKNLQLNFAVSFRVLKELKRLHIIKRVDDPNPRKVNTLLAKQCLNELI